MNTLVAVDLDLSDWSELREPIRDTVERFAVRFDEAERAVIEDDDLNAAFVHGVMVESTEADEIAELRLAAVLLSAPTPTLPRTAEEGAWRDSGR